MGRFLRAEEVIDAAVASHPERIALICGERRWTYGELRVERDRRAGVLVEAGLQVGDRMVTAERVSDDFVIALLACARAGGVQVALSPLLAAGEQAALTARIKPCVALTATGAPHPGLPIGTPLRLDLPGDPSSDAVAEAARRSAAGTDEDPVMMRHTSGTTGQAPKLVLRPHRQITWTCGNDPWPATPQSVFCVPTSTMLLVPEVCRTFALGATLVIPKEASVYGMEAELAAHGVNVIFAAPALLGALAQLQSSPPPNLRLEVLRTTGAAVPSELRAAVEARYHAPVYEEYGMAECIAIMRSPGPGTPAGSVGKPNPGVEVRLLDSAGHEVPEGAVGELVLRSPGLMIGYLDDPEANAVALRDGWYHTGDNACRDEQGYYYLLGRRGIQINVGGQKVSPEEVEAVLLQHPGVREAVVVPQPDVVRGEVVKAIIVREGDEPGAQELRRFCRARMAGYKVPRNVEFRREPLPRSALGKVLRQQL